MSTAQDPSHGSAPSPLRPGQVGPPSNPTNTDASAGLKWGVLSGVLGAIAMAIVTVLAAAITAFAAEGPAAGSGILVVFLLFAIPTALILGSIAGGLLGLALGATRKQQLAPRIGGLTPLVVLGIGGLIWFLADGVSASASDNLPGFLTILGAIVLFSPIGYLTGRFFSKKTNGA